MGKVLLYGYGNPGRRDDGLGIAFVNRLEEWAEQAGLDHLEFENNYQLNIEDAEAIAGKDLVIFADASKEDIADFCLSKVDESAKVAFTSHEASPGYVVKLCRDLFGTVPPVFLLHIKGYEWDFAEGLSEQAGKNLELAVSRFQEFLRTPEILLKEQTNLKYC